MINRLIDRMMTTTGGQAFWALVILLVLIYGSWQFWEILTAPSAYPAPIMTP